MHKSELMSINDTKIYDLIINDDKKILLYVKQLTHIDIWESKHMPKKRNVYHTEQIN